MSGCRRGTCGAQTGGGGSSLPAGRLPAQRTVTDVKAQLIGSSFFTECDLVGSNGLTIGTFVSLVSSVFVRDLNFFWADGSEFTQGTAPTDDIQVDAGVVNFGGGLLPPVGLTRLNFAGNFLSRVPATVRAGVSVPRSSHPVGAYCGAGLLYPGATDRILAALFFSATGGANWTTRGLVGNAAAPTVVGAAADYTESPGSVSATVSGNPVSTGGRIFSGGALSCGSSDPDQSPDVTTVSSGGTWQTDWITNTLCKLVIVNNPLTSGLGTRVTDINHTGFGA